MEMELGKNGECEQTDLHQFLTHRMGKKSFFLFYNCKEIKLLYYFHYKETYHHISTALYISAQ
jgi:hypothetical protein